MKKAKNLYNKYMNEFKKKKKVLTNKHHSSYWMNDDWSEHNGYSKFGGLSSDHKLNPTSDIVKLVKLTSYQRAIANFVKIVTNKEIPVVFAGSNSMTDGKRVVLASDISDKNFDVSVGLALHEASHIKLTDFKAVSSYLNVTSFDNYTCEERFKTIVNIIEDRRIDNYIFKTSPGYRTYYHKMYDHYFYSDAITKGIMSSEFRDPANWSHYEMRLANMTNPMTDLDALPGFRDIYDMIDVKNIGRLNSTQEVIELAKKVFDRILHEHKIAANIQSSASQSANQGSNGEGGDDQSNDGNNTNMGDDSNEQTDSNNTATPELTMQDRHAIQKAWDKQKDFISNNVRKKSTTKKLQDELHKVSKMDLDITVVGTNASKFNCIIFDLSSRIYLRQLVGLCKDYDQLSDESSRQGTQKSDVVTNKLNQIIQDINKLTNSNMELRKYWSMSSNMDLPNFLRGNNVEEIKKGIELGSLLGRKLQIRNEERSLVVNRLDTGKIDSKRLAHVGYGIENVFKQIHIDKYKQACLHISIDLSSSMCGKKWKETVQMTTAIAKAATYVQNLRIQVSARTTSDRGNSKKDIPVLINCYDSKYNDFKHFVDVMTAIRPSGTTPEGLCFDALLRRKMLVQSTNECSSYFLNISDGEPGMNGFGSHEGTEFTRRMVNKMKNDYNIGIISFYVQDSRWHNESEGTVSNGFREMYGKDSRSVNADNVTQIARELNTKFLSEGKYTV